MIQQPTTTALDVGQIRMDFPILRREVHPGVPLIYLDSTATTQKPIQVIQAMDDYYKQYNANVHRGVHTLAEEATAAYEASTTARGRLYSRTFCKRNHLYPEYN